MRRKLALAAAERQDVTFYYRDAAGLLHQMDADDPDKTAVLIRINLKQDMDLTAEGHPRRSCRNGREHRLRANHQHRPVSAGGAVRIKGQQGLYDARTDTADPVNIRSGSLILEAEEESIGTSTNRLLIDLQTGASLTARANNEIYITGYQSDIGVAEVL